MRLWWTKRASMGAGSVFRIVGLPVALLLGAMGSAAASPVVLEVSSPQAIPKAALQGAQVLDWGAPVQKARYQELVSGPFGIYWTRTRKVAGSRDQVALVILDEQRVGTFTQQVQRVSQGQAAVATLGSEVPMVLTFWNDKKGTRYLQVKVPLDLFAQLRGTLSSKRLGALIQSLPAQSQEASAILAQGFKPSGLVMSEMPFGRHLVKHGSLSLKEAASNTFWKTIGAPYLAWQLVKIRNERFKRR